MKTVWPCKASSRTEAGVSPTRCSSVLISLGTPICTFYFSLVLPIPRRAGHERPPVTLADNIGKSINQPPADEKENGCENRAQKAIRDAGCQKTAYQHAGHRADQKTAEQRPINAAEPPMTEAGKEGQRDGMGDIGRNQARGGQIP